MTSEHDDEWCRVLARLAIISALLVQEEVETWTRAHVEPVGTMELVDERPWGTVLRVPIAGGVAWFKACRRVQAFEPRLTAALARRWSDRLPEVLGCDEERAWLLLADAGQPLGFGGRTEPWLAVLPLYAELQRGETAHAGAHLAAGVPDRRLAAFPELYEAMLARGLPAGSGDVRRLHAFAPRFAELCDELGARGIPETIQHDDLHGANIYLRGLTPRVLDWGDSCVSHPFLTLFVTFMHLEELDKLPRHDPWYTRLRDAYLEPWGQPAELRDAFELAQRLGPFAHIFKELRVLDAMPEEQHPRFGPNVPDLLAGCVAATDSTCASVR